ncbi:MAG: hypothetical protein E2598_05655 [Sphingobium sp.]|nr:hypothetical protein [Sphingobium sp.]
MRTVRLMDPQTEPTELDLMDLMEKTHIRAIERRNIVRSEFQANLQKMISMSLNRSRNHMVISRTAHDGQ